MSKSYDVKKNSKKAALGRGLESLLGVPSEVDEEIELEEAVEAVKLPKLPSDNQQSAVETSNNNKIWQIPVEKLKPNKNQPRKHFDKKFIAELALSIKAHGIIQPILARKMESGVFEIVSGESRWRAAQKAGLKKVPVVLKEISNRNSMEIALIENIQRHDLNPIEEAVAYKELIDKYQLTQQNLSERLGKERATIANTLRLLGLSPSVRTFLAEGQLKMGQAKVLLSISDPAQQEEIARIAVKKQLTVRSIEKLVSAFKRAKKDTDVELKAINVSQQLIKGLVEELQKTVGTKIGIDYSKGKGKIIINYYSDEELNSYVDKIRKAWEQNI